MASTFKLMKNDGKGEFNVKYMEAAFDKEAQTGEFFIEFEDGVWNHKLIESFEAQGANSINTETFAHNDGGESASNALVRILTQQTKTKCEYTRGTCPPALYTKVHAKLLEADKQAQVTAKEFDEKTAASIKASLEEYNGKLEAIGSDMQFHTVKLEGIEHGVCNVIPDYQQEIKALKDALVKKTAACDTIEGRLAYKTRTINQQDAYIAVLEDEKQTWSREKATLLNKYATLQDESNMLRTLKHITEVLSATLAEERAAKRQRV
jgi:hypothetical protein